LGEDEALAVTGKGGQNTSAGRALGKAPFGSDAFGGLFRRRHLGAVGVGEEAHALVGAGLDEGGVGGALEGGLLGLAGDELVDCKSQLEPNSARCQEPRPV
jgi:hypothetical protein